MDTMAPSEPMPRPGVPTSIDKALDVCEALSASRDGLALTELAKAVGLPRPSVHRLLAVLKRRGYVRQDDDTQRYSLSLRMLDLSFRLVGRSDLRLHAYTVLRERAVAEAEGRSFVALTALDEVTYAWRTGADEPAMRIAYGRSMPAHCGMYFTAGAGTRRLSCLRLERAGDVEPGAAVPLRFGAPEFDGGQRLVCVCAPVFDYTGREVARVGVFGHGSDDAPMRTAHIRGAWDLGRLVSARLGHLPQAGPDHH